MYEFKFADIGEGIHEGVIHEWLVQVGDTVKDGQTLFTVETDKVTAEMPSPVDGRIHKINFNVGQTVHVGEVVVTIDDGKGEIKVEPVAGDATKTTVEELGSTSVVGEIEVSSAVIASSDEFATQEATSFTQKVLATPVARKMAKDLGVAIHTLKGSGPSGRVMKEDIQRAFDARHSVGHSNSLPSSPQKEPIPLTSSGPSELPKASLVSAQETRVKMSMLRKTIAKNMVLSKFTIPHTAAMDEVDVTALVAYRTRVNEILASSGERLTYMPFIIKAIAIALVEHPVLNASVDMEGEEIVYKHYYGIGMATDTPDGLMVPVVKAANTLSVLAISREVKRLGEGAKARTLTLKDMEGGTFTITNYGAIGAMYGVPVIKHPEVAILGIGTIYKKPAVDASGAIVIQDTLPLSISFDHRVVDGADAGRFLQTLKRLLSNPDLLLLS